MQHILSLLNLSLCLKTLWELERTSLCFGEGNGTPLQYSCLENPMDRGAWQAAVRGVAKSWTRLSDFTFTFTFTFIVDEHKLLLACSSINKRRRQWHPTPVLLPGKSHGRGSLVGCRLWGRAESDTNEVTQQQQQPLFFVLIGKTFGRFSVVFSDLV